MIAGEQQVVVAFDADALACLDGTPAGPGELAAGDSLSFTQVGDDVDTMLPPAVAGDQVRVDCP